MPGGLDLHVSASVTALSKTDWVRNGDRWIVEKVGRDGSLGVRHIELGRTVTLSPDYVQSATELGYAGTVHSAQGSTADICHVVATGDETRQLAYVGLTRGEQANPLYLATASDGDMRTAMTERGMLPPDRCRRPPRDSAARRRTGLGALDSRRSRRFAPQFLAGCASLRLLGGHRLRSAPWPGGDGRDRRGRRRGSTGSDRRARVADPARTLGRPRCTRPRSRRGAA
ncbi:hypothetical protein [Rhodococcus sp. 077-4]|uniref:hypothetical protein n=1 Tax=Rhodococcus sp. 077-4 TaxID=2789271 RepID=UPI0039F5454F